jgi:hypothetical protein
VCSLGFGFTDLLELVLVWLALVFQYVCSLGFGVNNLPELVLVVFSFGFSMFAVWALVSMICLSRF